MVRPWIRPASRLPVLPRNLAARSLAQLCQRVLLEYGADALAAARKGIVTEALVQVLDAIIAVSGMVSDLGGDDCAAAGAIRWRMGLRTSRQPTRCFTVNWLPSG